MENMIASKLKALHWSNPDSVQVEAIRTIEGDETFDPAWLLQDVLPQSCWENAAIILSKWGSPRVDDIIPALLCWLQDLNWPGALEVLVLLYDIPAAKTSKPLQDAIAEAKRENDPEWLDNLECLANREAHEQGIRAWLARHRERMKESLGEIYD